MLNAYLAYPPCAPGRHVRFEAGLQSWILTLSLPMKVIEEHPLFAEGLRVERITSQLNKLLILFRIIGSQTT
jgi:hypothetical protein